MCEGYGFKFNEFFKVNLLKDSFMHFQFGHESSLRFAMLLNINNIFSAEK